jgi:hypothetical protein
VSAGAATPVDAVIAVAEMSAIPANVAAAVRVFAFTACTAEAVVMPLPTNTAQGKFASSIAVAAVNVSVAVLVPVFVVPAVNVVVPQPLTARFDGVAKLKVGSSSWIESATFIGTLRANVKVNDDGACVTGFPSSIELYSNAGVGMTTAVERVIAVLIAMSVA